MRMRLKQCSYTWYNTVWIELVFLTNACACSSNCTFASIFKGLHVLHINRMMLMQSALIYTYLKRPNYIILINGTQLQRVYSWLQLFESLDWLLYQLPQFLLPIFICITLFLFHFPWKLHPDYNYLQYKWCNWVVIWRIWSLAALYTASQFLILKVLCVSCN